MNLEGRRSSFVQSEGLFRCKRRFRRPERRTKK
jgi:hypothetical protein